MRKKGNLTVKDKIIIKGLTEGKSLKEIGKEILPSVKYPSQAVYNRLQKPQIKAKLAELMERMGLDDESLLKVHRQLLKAKRTKAVRIIGSRVKAEIKEPDLDIRVRALDLAYKAKKIYGDTEAGQKIQINLILPGGIVGAKEESEAIEGEVVEQKGEEEFTS